MNRRSFVAALTGSAAWLRNHSQCDEERKPAILTADERQRFYLAMHCAMTTPNDFRKLDSLCARIIPQS